MSRISITPVEDLKWERAPAQDTTTRQSGRCFHHEGTEENPQLFEVTLPPGRFVEPHAHGKDEIIYILGGEMHVGDRVLKPGSSIAIQGETIYSFKAGPDGVHFLNFRPSFESGQMTPVEVKALRAQRNA